MSKEISRRTVIKAGTAVGVLAALQPMSATIASAQQGAQATTSLAKGFKAPPTSTGPWFRYWIPGSYPTPADVRADIDAMADAGFGGAEIIDLPEQAYFDPDTYGWGNDRWNGLQEAAVDQLRKRGMDASLTIGPAWPAAVPTITPDSPEASQHLVVGQAVVQAGGTYDDAPPASSVAPGEGVTVQTLVAVQAFRSQADTVPTSGAVGLVESSYVDLTPSVAGSVGDYHLTWQAPSEGTWVLIAFWRRGTAQTVNIINEIPVSTPQSYVIDHFSAAGTRKVTDFWEEHLLTRELKVLISRVNTSLFEDSIEVHTEGGQRWTPDYLTEFAARRGYALDPFLPLIMDKAGSSPWAPASAAYSFSSSVDSRVRRDYQQTQSDLYLAYHTYPIQEWAHRHKMTYKAQAYGLYIDTVLASSTIDQPEGETLDDGTYSERWRVIAGGAHLGQAKIMSDEMDATGQQAYRLAWGDFMLPTAYSNYAAGVNRGILHGYPTKVGPHSVWPGNDGFSGFVGPFGTGENWGPRMPSWTHITDMSGVLARTQWMLQQGKASIDLAVLRLELNKDANDEYWSDQALVRAGYTYDYQSPASLLSKPAKVVRGVLAPTGPGYRALVLNNPPSLSVDLVHRLISWCKEGLRIFVVGDLPITATGYADHEAQDAALAKAVNKLLAKPQVTRVANEAALPAALKAAGIRPHAEYGQSNAFRNTRRVDGAVGYYLVTNGGNTAVTDTISFAGSGVPMLLDQYEGQVKVVPAYQASSGRVSFELSLAAGDAALIAIAEPARFGVRAPKVPAKSSTGELIVVDGALAVRATDAGTVTTKLANGRSVDTAIASVAAPQNLTIWHLEVDDWQPANTTIDGDGAYQTKVVTHTLALTELLPWDQIDELKDVSGVGTYTANFTLPDGWTGGHGAYLDLGNVFDTFRVKINGRKLPPQNIIDTRIDVGGYLKTGKNTVSIEVTTTLNNRLRTVRVSDFGSKTRQSYGLIGPVVLTPYGQATV